MAIYQTACTVFKDNILRGVENFNTGTPYTYKIALYTANAILNADTLTYTSVGEVVGTGYTAGGKTLTISQIPTSQTGTTVAYISFANALWNPAAFTCRGALIYNSTTNAAVAILDFGADKTASSTFTVTFPTATSTTAILRIV
jgi:hypothetical protein